MAHLVEDNALDPSYVEDFLLTYRTFVKNPLLVTENLLNWFSDSNLRDKVSFILFCSLRFYLDGLLIYLFDKISFEK